MANRTARPPAGRLPAAGSLPTIDALVREKALSPSGDYVPQCLQPFNDERPVDGASLPSTHSNCSARTNTLKPSVLPGARQRIVNSTRSSLATPQDLTDDFVELVTPSATFALSAAERIAFITENTLRAVSNNSVIGEFLVEDAESLFATMSTHLGNDLDVAQPPTLMPVGQPVRPHQGSGGSPVNPYIPVTVQALELQRNRTPASFRPA